MTAPTPQPLRRPTSAEGRRPAHYEIPPDNLTWHEARRMIQAERHGSLRYNTTAHPIHGVSGNAMACLWQGLLADGDDGMVLTNLGRRLLAEWWASPEAQEYVTANLDDPWIAAHKVGPTEAAR